MKFDMSIQLVVTQNSLMSTHVMISIILIYVYLNTNKLTELNFFQLLF